jgi:hypothetical protein
MTSRGGRDMSRRGWVLRTGEYLVGRASRYLPPGVREERHQEWAAELPVILDDPAVRPAARRAARMLWFAADTLRGAAVARHVNRDAAGKARDPLTRQRLVDLLILPVLVGLGICLFYPGTGLTYDVVILLVPAIMLLSSLVGREHISFRRLWYVWGMLAWGTAQLLHDLAHDLGWGHPVLFEVIYYCGAAILVTIIGINVAGWVKPTHTRFL